MSSQLLRRTLSGIVLAFCAPPILIAAEWCVAPDGREKASGTREAPWDLSSTLGGGQKIAPGDTLWVAAGTYRHPDRRNGNFEVRLTGTPDRPIQVRGEPNARVTIDGGLAILPPSDQLIVRDLELLVSENFTLSREVQEAGSSPGDYNRPWGGLNIHAGSGCRYVNLVIHDCAQGVSFWSGATDSELYGCLIYDNGWKGPDRGHGHAIYTQNENGTKTIAECIMTGGYGYSMHAYGSSRAFVDNYIVEGCVVYDAGNFLIGGGRPSRHIIVRNNSLYRTNMQLGYSAPHNEDCEVRNNVIVSGGLTVNRFQRVIEEGNLVLSAEAARPSGPPRVEVRPNRHDPGRTHVVVFNWPRADMVEFLPGSVLTTGERFRLMNPRDPFGKPVLTGTFDGGPIRVPLQGEFAAWVLLKAPSP